MQRKYPSPADASFFFGLGVLILSSGFNALAESPERTVQPSAAPSSVVETASAARTATDETKSCFQCNGAKTTKCQARSCVNGMVDCPGSCLKLSTPGWQRMNVAGHSPDEWWMKFRDLKGNGSQAWTQGHIGQVVKRDAAGCASIVEICPVCKGSAHVKCTSCQGTGVASCSMCNGSGAVPVSWTALENPKMKNRPEHFKLKDGSEITGRRELESEDVITVRTEKGIVNIKKTDLLPVEPGK